MPVSVRELFVVVRASDQASRTLRAVGTNVRSLGRAQDFANARARLQNRMSIAQSNVVDLQTRQIALESAIAEQTTRATAAADAYAAAQARVGTVIEANVAAAEQFNRQSGLMMANAKRSAEAQLAGVSGPFRGPSGSFISRDEAAQLKANAMMAEQVQLRTQTMARAQVDAEAASTRAGKAAKYEAAQLATLQNASSKTAARLRMQNQIVTEGGQALQKLDEAQRRVKWERLTAAGRAMSSLGTHMQFVGGIGVAALGLAANSAAKFSTSVTLAATQASRSLGGIADKSNQAQEAILKQMQKFPATATDMSKSLYDIFSGTNVQTIAGGTRLLSLFNRAAVAGQTDLNTATQAGITIMNTYGKSVNDMPGLLNKMFAAVRYGRMNFTEFGNSLNQIVPAFKSAHQSLDVMLGSLAFLTRRIPSVRMAGTSLARATEVLGNPKMIDNLRHMGVNIADVHKNLLPLPIVLDRIVKKFPQLAKGANVMSWVKSISGQQGTIQARRALVFLFQNLGAYQRMLKQVSGDQGEFTRSYAALANTSGVRWSVFLSNLRSLWLQLGKSAIPTLIGMTKPLQQLVHWFSALSQSTRTQIGRFAVMATVGLLVGGTVIRLVGMLTSLVGILGELRVLAAISALLKGAGGAAVIFTRAIVQGEGAMAGFQGATAYLTAALGGGAAIATVGLGAALLAVGGYLYYVSTETNGVTQHVKDLRNELNKVQDPLKHMYKFLQVKTDIGSQLSDFNKQLRDTENITRHGSLFKKMDPLTAQSGTLQQFAGAMQQRYGTANPMQHSIDTLKQGTHDLIGLQGQWTAKVFDTVNAYNKLSNAQQKRVSRNALANLAGANVAALGFGRIPQQIASAVAFDTGKIIPPALLTRMREFTKVGRNAGAIIYEIGTNTHKLVNATQLDQILSLPKKRIAELLAYVQAHHKLPTWLLKVDIKKAIADTGKVAATAKKFASGTYRGRLNADPTAALKGISQATVAAQNFAGKRFTAHLGIDISGLLQGLSAGAENAFAAGARIATQAEAGFRSASQTHSPSKVFMRIGRDLIEGLVQGMASKQSDIKSQAQSAVGAIQTQFDDLKSTMQSAMGDLFTGTPRNQMLSTIAGFGGAVPFSIVRGDLASQIGQFRHWRNLLNRLASQGAPPNLIMQLQALGPAAIPELQSLVTASRPQRASYFRMWRESQNLITNASKSSFQMQVRIWQSMGKNVAFGFLAGLRSETPNIVRFIQHMMKILFGAAQKHNKSHSPSMLWFREGRNMMLGLQAGMDSVAVGIPPVGGWRGGSGVVRNGDTVHYHYHQTVYSGSASAEAVASKSVWEYRRRMPTR